MYMVDMYMWDMYIVYMEIDRDISIITKTIYSNMILISFYFKFQKIYIYTFQIQYKITVVIMLLMNFSLEMIE